jgi:hypothetical protein
MTAKLCHAEDLPVSQFSAEGLNGWEQKSFKGTTDYRLVNENGTHVVKATSNGTASGLVKKMAFDPYKYRFLRWSWKIDHTVSSEDERTKAGDDYAARVYVIFSGKFFWQTRAINYIWANRLGQGKSIPNAFTKNAMMVAVESGETNAGQWLSEERDILADYRWLFGEDPKQANAIAIMTDTDNTGLSAAGWYGNIFLSTIPQKLHKQ